jgi:hypothetical protein
VHYFPGSTQVPTFLGARERERIAKGQLNKLPERIHFPSVMQNGSKVVCVDDVFPAWARASYTALPVKGVTYTVRSMSPGRGKPLHIVDGKPVKNGAGDAHPEIYLLVEELRNPPDPFCAGAELGFKAERFAPMEESENEAVYEEAEAKGAFALIPGDA